MKLKSGLKWPLYKLYANYRPFLYQVELNTNPNKPTAKLCKSMYRAIQLYNYCSNTQKVKLLQISGIIKVIIRQDTGDLK